MYCGWDLIGLPVITRDITTRKNVKQRERQREHFSGTYTGYKLYTSNIISRAHWNPMPSLL